MSIIGKDFEIQKQNITADEIERICQGINRIRFIKNRVADKANFILHLLSNQQDISKPKTDGGSLNFITTSSLSTRHRPPLTELRNRQDRKPSNIIQTNHHRVSSIKKETKELLLAAQVKQRQEIIKKLENKKRLQKQRQLGRTKIKDFFAGKNKCVKEFKGHLMKIHKRKLEVEEGSLEIYENKILQGERLKELILKKLETSQSRIKQH